MQNQYPFTITKRNDRPFYYVSFRDEKTGRWLPRKSTGETEKSKAVKKAFEWYAKGVPQKDRSQTVETLALRNTIKLGLNNLSRLEQEFLLAELKKQGVIKSFVLSGGKSDVVLTNFLLEFWDYEKSEYVAERLRSGFGITRQYCKTGRETIIKYWTPFFREKLFGDVTRQDLRDFMRELDKAPIKNRTKQRVLFFGFKAIKWAYNNEIIERDITAGIGSYSGKSAVREILTPEIVQALFSVEWNDPRAKLANMLAMCTGMRAGEIQALRLRDLGVERIYVNHSWNEMEGLKSTKNGEARTAYLPFPVIVDALKKLAEENPYNQGLDGFVFWATIPTKPMESKTFLKELRLALQKCGLPEESAKKYTFHAWRHFFTAYMSESVNQKILQKQTGHKTVAMLEHYANHEIPGDVERLENAQIEAFGGFVNRSAVINFNSKKLYDYVQTGWKEAVNG